jgi:hypothetical protein
MLGALCLTLGSLGAVSVVSSAGATDFVVQPIPDGDPDSLRDVLENQIVDGDTVILVAGATYDLTCAAGGSLSPGADVTINGNGATIRQTCDELVMDVPQDLTLNNVVITGGFDDDDRPAGGIHFDGDELIINNSSIVGNQTCGDGGGINMDSNGLLRIVNSTIANNSAAEGGGISSHADTDGQLQIINSTITNNSAVEGGGIWAHDGGPVQLVYVTIVENAADTPAIDCANDDAVDDSAAESVEETADPTAPTGAPAAEQAPAEAGAGDPNAHADGEDVSTLANGTGANIDFDDDEGSILTTFASVIALPVEGENCAEDLAPLTDTISNGYNFSDDASCGLAGTGDRQSAGNPLLGALAANGGPTQTRLPLAGSGLVDGVLLAACQADGAAGIANDQRGVTRPQQAGCDIGAVEIELVLSFTG